MTKIKTVFMDLDGSTLIEKNIIPANLRNLILQHSEINWIITTGRSYPSMIRAPFAEILPSDSIHITEGGARLSSLAGKLFKEFLLQPHEINEFFQTIELDQIDYVYYCHIVNEGQGWFRDVKIEQQFHLPLKRKTYDFNEFKLWTQQTTPAKLALYRNTEELSLGKLNWNFNNNYVDVTTSGVNKGSAAITMLEHLGHSAQEAIFIFNDYNDLPLINALPTIKKLKVGSLLTNIEADYQVATPEQVADVLKLLF